MTVPHDSIVAATYAMFALQQPLSLAQLTEAARDTRFPMASAQTPEWFAAAASGTSSLLETAPELVVLPADLDSADAVDVSGMDLVHMYAPELESIEEIEEPAAVAAPETEAPAAPRTSTQLGLLKELGNLDT